MTIFSSFDIASADGAFASFDEHEASISIQAHIFQNQTFSATSTHNKQQHPDHCPDCHECHFGHCGIILENKISINKLNIKSNLNRYEHLFVSRDFHYVFRPPIIA